MRTGALANQSAGRPQPKVNTIMTFSPRPPMLPVRHVRIARPTDQLDAVVRF
jgi:hypothetical protein